MATVCEKFLNVVAAAPEKVFCHFISEGRSHEITYSALVEESFRFAGLLQEHKSVRGEVVFIILPHSPSLYSAFLGAIVAGCVPSFMPPPSVRQDPGMYLSSHQKLFSRIGARFLITDRKIRANIAGQFDQGEIKVLLSEDLPNPQEFQPVNNPLDVAILQHSSGTTGLKKGVALSHSSVITQIESYGRALSFSGDASIASWLPLYHDMGLMACFMLPLLHGATVVSMDPFEWVLKPGTLLDAIEKFKCSHTWLPNFAFNHLVRSVPQSHRPDLSSMKAFINCSEPCKPATFRSFAHRFTVPPEKLHTCYAMAENTFAVTQSLMGTRCRGIEASRACAQETASIQVPRDPSDVIEFLSCGKPIAGVSIQVRDARGQPLPDGRIGTIAIGGSSLFSGYHKLPSESAQALNGGWYTSGDLGFVENGELFITGRANDLIIAHGKNLYAHDLEELLSHIPGLKPGRAVAFGRHDSTLGTENVFVVAEVPDIDMADVRYIQRTVKESVYSHFNVMPKHVEIVGPGWLVKTTSGKISRELNAKKFFEYVGSSHE